MSTNGAAPNAPQDVVARKKKSGAQPGNVNRLKTGKHSVRNRANRSQVARLKRAVRNTLLLAAAAQAARTR